MAGNSAKMKVSRVAVSSLEADPRNVRLHSSRNRDTVRQSFEEFGQRIPIVVADGVVISGNARLAVARELGWTHIDTVDASDLTPEQRTAYAIADNRTAELAEWDTDALAQQIAELSEAGVDVADLGWTAEDLEALLAMAGDLPEDADGQEFDESAAEDVKYHKCPKCDHEFPA